MSTRILTAAQEKDLERRYTYHPPTGDQGARHKAIKEAAREFAALVMVSTPGSQEQFFALSKIDEAMMWASAAIARNE